MLLSGHLEILRCGTLNVPSLKNTLGFHHPMYTFSVSGTSPRMISRVASCSNE